MNRRDFLRLFAAASPAAAVAPTYFFAPVGGWKSDLILNPYESSVPLGPVDACSLSRAYNRQNGMLTIEILKEFHRRMNLVYGFHPGYPANIIFAPNLPPTVPRGT